eukprot:4147349-Prorocentrum_lima.AAC.1
MHLQKLHHLLNQQNKNTRTGTKQCHESSSSLFSSWSRWVVLASEDKVTDEEKPWAIAESQELKRA